MATLTRNTNWTASADQTSQTRTYTFSTANKMVDKNISLTVNVNYLELGNNSTFVLNDGINTWTWTKDANGNVTIT